MYIALKWLISLVLVMWLALCFHDVHRKKNFRQQLDYDVQSPYKSVYNTTARKVFKKSYNTERIKITKDSHTDMSLQYLMFLAGACMVTAYNRKNEIMRFIKRKIYNINFDSTQCLKKTAKLINAARVNYKIIIAQLFEKGSFKINLLLIEKIKKFLHKRRNISKPLITNNQVITIGMRCNLETEIKNKDELNEFSKKQSQENRSTNTSFQQLYLVTYQENIFLKLRIKKLSKEKEEAERKLIKLINQVCRSKNNDLKVYCSKFIVHTKNNLLNSDVKAEIDNFLRKCSDEDQEKHQSSEQTIHQGNCDCLSIKFNEFFDDKAPAVRNTSKVRGERGEYVWTVKDKNGIIERLYECAGDCDNSDTLKRIRQYSVYYDTECLIDFSNSTNFDNVQDADVANARNTYSNFKLTVTNRRFLSSSPAFQNFLQNNNSIIPLASFKII